MSELSAQPSAPGASMDDERLRVLALLRAFGFNATSFQILEPGYRYFFDGDACVAYCETGGAWVAAGAPIAPETRLRDVVSELDRRGCKIMLSNSDVPFIRGLYGKFRIDTVAAPRAINCDAEKRGMVSEVVVRNY